MSKPINKIISKTTQKIKTINKQNDNLEPIKEHTKEIQSNEQKEEIKEEEIILKKTSTKDIKENIKEQKEEEQKNKKPKSNINNMMERTNLYFNTTQIKKYVISKINNENMSISKIIINKEHPENKEKKDVNITCGNSIYALSALMDLVVYYIMDKVSKNNDIKENELGIKNISYEMIEKEIYKNNDMRYNFLNYILTFNENKINYTGLFIFNEKVIREFVDNKFTKRIKLDNKSINFLSYILIDILNETINNAYILMKYYDKTQMNLNIILHICMIKFKGEFLNTIKIRLEDTMKLIEQINEENRKLNEEKNNKKEDEEKEIKRN